MTDFSQDCLDRMARVTTATLTTQLFKRGIRNVFMQGVRPLGRYGANLVGPAFTLRNIPAREDLDRLEGFADPEHPQRKAIEATPPGVALAWMRPEDLFFLQVQGSGVLVYPDGARIAPRAA